MELPFLTLGTPKPIFEKTQFWKIWHDPVVKKNKNTGEKSYSIFFGGGIEYGVEYINNI